MNEVKIRGAVPGDDRALAELDHRAWSPDSAVTERPPAESAFFGPGTTPDQFLVAVPGGPASSGPASGGPGSREPGSGGGQPAGYVRVIPPTTLPSNAHVRQICGLAVEPSLRGGGIGRALVDAACDWASRAGARRITLRVLSSNAPARRLYEAAGFTVEGVLPGEFHIAGRHVDDIMMGRPLS